MGMKCCTVPTAARERGAQLPSPFREEDSPLGVNKKPLNRSVTIGSTVFLMLLALILSVATYLSFRQSMYERFEAQMTDTLNYIDSHIDHDDLAQCVRTRQPSEKYKELQLFLDDIFVTVQ